MSVCLWGVSYRGASSETDYFPCNLQVHLTNWMLMLPVPPWEMRPMQFVICCSKRLANNVAIFPLFHGPGFSTRRVLSIRQRTLLAPRRAFASAASPLAEDSTLLAVGGSGLIKLK